ncbi:MAG: S1C family serine protease [Planctomycetaceae bacterium]
MSLGDIPPVSEDENWTPISRFEPSESADIASSPESRPRAWDAAPPELSQRRGRAPRSVDSSSTSSALGQAMFFLLAMATMLAAARFAMPSIVEEVRYAWHRGELRAEYETSGEGLKNVSLDALSDAYQMVTKHVGPSVVHIDVRRAVSDREGDVTSFLSAHGADVLIPLADQGSGVVVDADGFIVTNRHVIADGDSIMVGLSDGRRVPARVIGTDALTDIALLKVDADRLLPIQWGDSDRCDVGTPVWAVGSPFGLDRTVTFGILSGKHRMVKASTRYQDFMQSDVAVNPGNSGGPLVDVRGKLIGINTAIVGDTYRGVSFSIPSNVAKEVYQRLKANGRYDRGWLGIALAEVPDDLFTGEDHRQRGALVTSLAGNESPAAVAGLLAGDIIERVDQIAISDMGHLMRIVGSLSAGSKIQIDVRRGEKPLVFSVVIGARPALDGE